MIRSHLRSLHTLTALSLFALTGCGIENSLVGGQCADGFEYSGGKCVASAAPGAGTGAGTGAQPTDTTQSADPATPTGLAGDDSAPAKTGVAPSGTAVSPLGSQGGPDLLGLFGPGRFDAIDLEVIAADPLAQNPITQLPAIDPTPPPVAIAPELTCASSLVACHGACIPVADDGMNCGACGKICPSNICVAGECQGATPGDVVLIGHDFMTARAGTAQTKVLLNALSIPTTDPIRVLSYEDGASDAAVAQAKALATAGIRGRRVVFTRADSVESLESATLNRSYDIVLLHDASSGHATDIGSRWSTSLGTFAQKGGVVIALDDASSPMPTLLSSAGLLAVSGHTKLAESAHLLVSAAGDVVGAQVLSPYATSGSPVTFQGSSATDQDLTWVVRHDAPGGGDPVVLHRIVR